MRSTLGKIKRALFNRIYHYVYMNSIKAYWYPYDHNFGDILNPLFINKLSGKKIIWINPKFYRYKNYLVIGSILDRVNKYSTVWGAGFISEDGECPEKPAKVCAVRGPLS
ncbi:MAG TPA: hypothetical protein ENK66_02955, partial [Arcobacter sp.]|nr:hypothetical protein [Arcobacter sp.]